ncbi:hypothetical protein VCHA53O466_50372 [Vibrio chagasii]|nr:hypothetical protein VCHA53O466_50372 [Vibrio chagasii]
MDINNSINSEQPVLMTDIAMNYLCGLSGSEVFMGEQASQSFIGANLHQIIKNTPQVIYVESDREQLVNDYIMSQALINGVGSGMKFGIFVPERCTDYVATLYSCLSGVSKSKLVKNDLNGAEVEYVSTTAHESVSAFIDKNEMLFLNGVVSIDDIDRYLSTSDIDVLIISAGIAQCMSNEDLELLQFSTLLYDKKIIVGLERYSRESLRDSGVISKQQSSHIRLELVEGFNVLCDLKVAGSGEFGIKGAWDFDCHRLAFCD